MSIKRTGSLDQALNRLVSSNEQHVQVGVLDNTKYPDGTSVASVAFWNEYGTNGRSGKAKIPPRPFFRDTIKQKKDEWSNLARQGIRVGYSIDKVLGLVGTAMQRDIQDTIDAFKTPKNADYTVALKGFDKPLINTTLLRSSIKYEVKDGKL